MKTETLRDWNSASWLRTLFPILLLKLRLGAAGTGGTAFGKFSSASSNDQATFLPVSTESTAVNTWQKTTAGSEAAPAIAVMSPDTSLTGEQLKALAALALRFSAITGVHAPKSPDTGSVTGPVLFRDGPAIRFLVPTSDTSNVNTVVGDLLSLLVPAAPHHIGRVIWWPSKFSNQPLKEEIR